MNTEINTDLINNYKTPFYAFDLAQLKKRVMYLRQALPEKVKLCYAIKANPFLSGAMNDYIDKYEICSPGELSICMEQGLPVSKFIVSGVYKNYDDMLSFINKASDKACCTVESLTQYEDIKSIAKKTGNIISVLLRLTSGNQFGLSKDDIKKIITQKSNSGLIKIKGIQFYSTTQKSNVKKLEKEITMLDEFVLEIKRELGFNVEELEYGPGFPAEYFEPFNFDEKEYTAQLSSLINSIKSNVSVTLEIGRGIAYSCGTYVTSVVDKKTNETGNYAIVDGGINHIVYYGQMMAMKKPKICIYPYRESVGGEKWNICGSLCTVNDILLKNIEVKNLEIGDKLIFYNTGAYCVTEGISLFLSRALPSVLFIDENGKIHTARKHENTYKLNYKSNI